MIPLSCQADLPHLRALRDASIKKILHTTAADGFLGPKLPNATNGKNPDIYWGRMSLVLGLQVRFEPPFPIHLSSQRFGRDLATLLPHFASFCLTFRWEMAVFRRVRRPVRSSESPTGTFRVTIFANVQCFLIQLRTSSLIIGFNQAPDSYFHPLFLDISPGAKPGRRRWRRRW